MNPSWLPDTLGAVSINCSVVVIIGTRRMRKTNARGALFAVRRHPLRHCNRNHLRHHPLRLCHRQHLRHQLRHQLMLCQFRLVPRHMPTQPRSLFTPLLHRALRCRLQQYPRIQQLRFRHHPLRLCHRHHLRHQLRHQLMLCQFRLVPRHMPTQPRSLFTPLLHRALRCRLQQYPRIQQLRFRRRKSVMPRQLIPTLVPTDTADSPLRCRIRLHQYPH